MSQEILIILAKAGYCKYCKDFKPIYEIAKDKCKLNDFLKDYNIKFDDYDMANNDVRNTFMITHNKIKDQIKWYPTVFVNIRNTSDKKNMINEYRPIEHTIIDPKIDEKKQQEEAAKRFLENIKNGIKTLQSDSKTNYIQTGGTSKNEIYKSKYLKYKSKYYELKNKLN